MENTSRIVWADVIRLIAILMVISIHCADPFNVSPEARMNPEYSLWGSIYGSFMRPCVPLFVMLTGMLLLPVKESMGVFYKKRLLRVAVPFIVWSLLYNLFPWITGIAGLDSSVLSKMFAYAGESPDQSFGGALTNILLVPFNFNTYTVPLWYIYMLIGLYLIMPFFSAWLKQATARQMKVFLGIWALTLFIPYCQEFISANIGGVCAWNDFGILYYFSGFIGYLLLGYLLKGWSEKMTFKKTLAVASVMFAAGFTVTFLGFRDMSVRQGITERELELFFMYCSPNVMLMTVAWYIVIQKTRVTSPRVLRALSNIAKCGLGIYMIHYFIVWIGYFVIEHIGIPVPVRIPATAIFVFMVAWGIVALFNRMFPKLSRWVMSC